MTAFAKFKTDFSGKKYRNCAVRVNKFYINYLCEILKKYYPELATASFADRIHFLIYLLEKALKEKDFGYEMFSEVDKEKIKDCDIFSNNLEK